MLIFGNCLEYITLNREAFKMYYSLKMLSDGYASLQDVAVSVTHVNPI